MRSRGDFRRVQELIASGLSDYAIGRQLAIPRATVQNWRLRAEAPRGLCARTRPWRPPNRRSYSYLFGTYLGDGVIWRTSRHAWRLAITLDQKHPRIVNEVRDAVLAVLPPDRSVCVNGRPGALIVLASSHDWPHAFPQHGPGKKHERTIRLTEWQERITLEHPRALLRGLIHSDGCRTINRFKTELPNGRVASYAYPRYFFTNLSADIRAIFCRHCDLLGIRWSQSNARNISVSHRDSVALLDSFIGPKQ